MLCVGVLESSSRQVSLRYLLYFVTAILLSLMVLSTVEQLDQLKRLAAFGAAGLPVATAYGVYQRVVLGLTNTSLTVDLTLNSDMPGRVYSFFDNANTFAQVLVMLLGVTLGLLFASRTLWGRLASLAALICGLAGIAMTYSRASWVGLVVAVFLFILLCCPRFIPVLILGAVVLLPLLPASIYNRILTIFDTSDSSTSSRFPIYEVGMKMWSQAPVTGIGLGSELSASAALSSGWYHGTFKFPHYHNIYIQLAVETGALGLLAYLGGFLASCKQVIRAVLAPSCSRPVRCLAAGYFSGLAGVMVCGLADYFWHYPRVMAIFWLIFGMMLACVRLARGEREPA
jgi:O-antigen ligase